MKQPKFTKQELGYLYKLVGEDLEYIAKKRTLPAGYCDTAQNVELKLSAICKNK
jgi:hypothetical protein